MHTTHGSPYSHTPLPCLPFDMPCLPALWSTCGLCNAMAINETLSPCSGMRSRMSAVPENKYVVTVLTVVVVILVLVGCGINDLEDKYSRYSHPQTCSKGVLALNMKSSEFCCDDPLHQTEWICLAAYDFVNSVMTSLHAFYIPLLPSIFTLITDVLYFDNGTAKKSSVDRISGTETSRLTWGGNFVLKVQDFNGKLNFNMGIILYRTVRFCLVFLICAYTIVRFIF